MATTQKAAQVTLNESGCGVATIAVDPGETWIDPKARVHVDPPSREATCIVVTDNTNGLNFRDGTSSGSSGDSSDLDDCATLRYGERIHAIWIGGTPGATASIIVTAEMSS
jgi:hypothetical protein